MSDNYRHSLETDAITCVKMGKMYLLPVEVLSFYKAGLEEGRKCWQPVWENKGSNFFLGL